MISRTVSRSLTWHYRAYTSGLVEHHRAVAVHQHPPLQVVTQAAGQHAALHIAPKPHQIVLAAAVIHPHHVLLDDGTLVQVGGDVMTGSADQLDPAVVGLLVGIGADEGRQEAVMDVDQTILVLGAEVGRHDLHEARQHHRIRIVAVDKSSRRLINEKPNEPTQATVPW